MVNCHLDKHGVKTPSTRCSINMEYDSIFLLFLDCFTSWLNFRNIFITMAVIFRHENSCKFPFNGH